MEREEQELCKRGRDSPNKKERRQGSVESTSADDPGTHRRAKQGVCQKVSAKSGMSPQDGNF